MKNLTGLILTLYWFVTPVFAQNQSVPYRVGNKFGVGTTDGKMIISADYDIMQPESYNDYKYYVAYKLAASGNLSTLIYKDKIIFKDQKYNSYYINNELIKAIRYKVVTKSIRYDNDNFKETEHLYDLKGKKLFEGDFKSIAVIDDIDEERKVAAVLIYTHDLNNIESLYLYDTKLKKITKTFIDNAKSIDVDFNYSYNYRDRSIMNMYLDKNGIGRKMIIELKDNAIVMRSDEPFDIKKEQRNPREGGGWGDPTIAMEDVRPPINLNSKEESKLLTARKIEEKRGFYYLQKKVEELSINTINLKETDRFIVSKNNKQGLYTVYNQTYLIPIEYDEIIFADFDGRNGGYILRDGDKYGAFIYFTKENKIVKPIFEKMPLPVDVNYFGDAKPLFKLYGEDGKLFCYGDEFGKLFYKK